MKVFCCGKEAIWVENVPGKGYNFCPECRKEVLTPITLEPRTLDVEEVSDEEFDFWSASKVWKFLS